MALASTNIANVVMRNVVLSKLNSVLVLILTSCSPYWAKRSVERGLSRKNRHIQGISYPVILKMCSCLSRSKCVVQNINPWKLKECSQIEVPSFGVDCQDISWCYIHPWHDSYWSCKCFWMYVMSFLRLYEKWLDPTASEYWKIS